MSITNMLVTGKDHESHDRQDLLVIIGHVRRIHALPGQHQTLAAQTLLLEGLARATARRISTQQRIAGRMAPVAQLA